MREKDHLEKIKQAVKDKEDCFKWFEHYVENLAANNINETFYTSDPPDRDKIYNDKIIQACKNLITYLENENWKMINNKNQMNVQK